MVHDDNLGLEGSGLLRGVVLRVTADVTTTNVLDGNVLDVETDVVSGKTSLELLVVHLDRLDFDGDSSGSKLVCEVSLTAHRNSDGEVEQVALAFRYSKRNATMEVVSIWQ